MARKPETKITQDMIAWIKRQGGDAFHVSGSIKQRGGEPDIDGSVPILSGKNQSPANWVHLKIEVKTQTGTPEERQLNRLREYNKRGYLVGVLTGVDELNMLLYHYIRWLHLYGGNDKYLFGQYLLSVEYPDQYNIYGFNDGNQS